MARSKKNSRSSKSSKKSKPSRRAEPEAEVLEQVDGGGWGIDEGLVFTTFALLVGAVFMVWKLLGERYPDVV